MKIVVIDDDPTGSQTVHSCSLLLNWDVEALRGALRNTSPLFFVLANTRALLPEMAAERNQEICSNLKKAMTAEGIRLKDLLLVSRGDSTLRGHGFLEPQVIGREFGPFDATFHVPAFFEGGRTTIGGVHFLNGIEVHTTPFAKDQVFGYSTSDLACWLEEKSAGCISKENVMRLNLEQLEKAGQSCEGMQELEDWLLLLSQNQSVIVDAACPQHLQALSKALRKLHLHGHKRFLFRSAASLINALAEVDPQLLSVNALSRLRRRDQQTGLAMPGMVVVGSYMPLANSQLECLFENTDCVGIELQLEDIGKAFENGDLELFLPDLKKTWLTLINESLLNGKTPVLFTSRREISFSTSNSKLSFGNFLALLIAQITATFDSRLGYLISKGGITTHVLLSEGLNLKVVNLEGQLLPGLSLVKPLKKRGLTNYPIITFPGNLGTRSTLLDAWRLMEAC